MRCLPRHLCGLDGEVMKGSGKYRFSLQFPAHTESQIAVGEALEKMGNRKSALIVDAVFRYLNEHADLVPAFHKHKSRPQESGQTYDENALMCSKQSQKIPTSRPQQPPADDSVGSMLDNLSLFR